VDEALANVIANKGKPVSSEKNKSGSNFGQVEVTAISAVGLERRGAAGRQGLEAGQGDVEGPRDGEAEAQGGEGSGGDDNVLTLRAGDKRVAPLQLTETRGRSSQLASGTNLEVTYSAWELRAMGKGAKLRGDESSRSESEEVGEGGKERGDENMDIDIEKKGEDEGAEGKEGKIKEERDNRGSEDVEEQSMKKRKKKKKKKKTKEEKVMGGEEEQEADERRTHTGFTERVGNKEEDNGTMEETRTKVTKRNKGEEYQAPPPVVGRRDGISYEKNRREYGYDGSAQGSTDDSEVGTKATPWKGKYEEGREENLLKRMRDMGEEYEDGTEKENAEMERPRRKNRRMKADRDITNYRVVARLRFGEPKASLKGLEGSRLVGLGKVNFYEDRK
jgi:hypothetical protein